MAMLTEVRHQLIPHNLHAIPHPACCPYSLSAIDLCRFSSLGWSGGAWPEGYRALSLFLSPTPSLSASLQSSLAPLSGPSNGQTLPSIRPSMHISTPCIHKPASQPESQSDKTIEFMGSLSAQTNKRTKDIKTKIHPAQHNTIRDSCNRTLEGDHSLVFPHVGHTQADELKGIGAKGRIIPALPAPSAA